MIGSRQGQAGLTPRPGSSTQCCMHSFWRIPPELHTPRPCQVQVFSPLLLCWEAIALTQKGTAVVQWALFIHAQPLFHCTVLVL